MKASDILKALESWLIPDVRFKNDPFGLLVGDKKREVTGVLVSLNITPDIVNEAIEKNCNLIISHHPLFYKPMNKIVKGEYYSDIVIPLIENKISLISYHTVFDLVKDGVSYELARTIRLENIKPLIPLSKLRGVELQENYKLVVYTPVDHIKAVKDAISEAGGATIGEYDYCFFESEGHGYFRGSENTDPFIGKKGQIEKVKEVKIETIVPKWNLRKVLNAVYNSHPYEEPAIDVFKIENESGNFGIGAVGELKEEMSIEDFADVVKTSLNTKSLRVAKCDKVTKIKKVAVCGGAGASFWKDAYFSGADIYLTSDFSHHAYLEAKECINILDATHHATEKVAIAKLSDYIKNTVRDLSVIVSEKDLDPVDII